MTKNYFYARCSSTSQNTEGQVLAAKQRGMEFDVIFNEKVSGKNLERRELQRMLSLCDSETTVVVSSLSRLSRSLKDLLDLVTLFEERGTKLVSLTEQIDTSTAMGRAFLQIIGVLSSMERELILERQAIGIQAAIKRNVRFGRPKALSEVQKEEAIRLMNDGRSTKEVARLFEVSEPTMRRVKRISRLELVA
jgi:DNA invertase Pin-like site-specific DNA recombinase